MTSPPDDILDLLTAYALDALDPDEVARVSALLAAQPELRTTLAELRATADMLPYGLPEATPPADLRQRVLARATGRAGTGAGGAPARAASRARGWLLALGSLAALAVLAAVIGWTQLFSTRGELAQVRTELRQTQAQVAEAAALIATLNGSGGSASILRTQAGETVLVAELPPLDRGRVYQLWRIQGQNAPVSAGVFRVNQDGHTTTELLPGQQPLAGEIVAVTNEPDGGSSTPTSDPLIVGPAEA
jgi:anti-sigma-K factor RskA